MMPTATDAGRDHLLSPDAAAVRAQMDRILQSSGFRSAGVLRHLLGYLADRCLAGEGDSLKEYSIGLDALGKPPSFDPRQESVVRMHTARLRQKLSEYYRTDGVADPILVDLPKGGFRLTFETRSIAPEPVPATRPEPRSESRPEPRPEPRSDSRLGWSLRERVMAASLVLVFVIAAAAWLRPARTDQAEAIWTPELRELWGPLLSPARRLVVCIATPLFVDVPGFGAIRDSSLNDWDLVQQSKGLSSVEKALGVGMSQPSFLFVY